MRILHLTTFLQGGAGRIIAALAVAQRRSGHDVTVVADDGGEDGYGSYPEYLAALATAGVGYATVRSTFKRELPLAMQAAQQLRAIAGPSPPDIVHTHASIPTLVARVAFGPARVRLVQTMHGWGVRKTPDQVTTDLSLLAAADAVVTPSDAARRFLHALGLVHPAMHVIPYGLDPAASTAPVDAADVARLRQVRAGGARVAVCLGTIGARKNQALLVAALTSLPEFAAVFIGDGEGDALEAMAASQGVGARVHVLGYRSDASRYLPYADVLVLPSRNEGLPIAVLEALRAGVPVVASAIPEIAEAIEDGRTGYLCTPDDPLALAAALRRSVVPEVRASMAAAARATFAARYELTSMTRAYDRVYRGEFGPEQERVAAR